MSNFQDNLSELFDIPHFLKQVETAKGGVRDYLSEVTETHKIIQGLSKSISDASNLKQLQASALQAAKISSQNALTTERLAKARLADAKAATEQAKALKIATEGQIKKNKADADAEKQTEKLTEAKKKLSKEQQQEGKFNKSAIGSLHQLKASLSIARAEYDKLSADIRENTVEGQAQLLNIQRITNELKRLEGQMGVHGRSVGDYTSHWNGLNHSVSQVAREIPAFANSFNTGIMAISNNLPMLADEIKKVRLENARLAADGKKGVPVWKQVAGSLFNWQTALIAVVTVLATNGDDITNWLRGTEDAAEKAAKGIDELTEAIEKLQAADEAVSKERDNITKFLVARAKAEGKSAEEIAGIEKDQLDRRIRDQKNYIQELNKIYKQQVADRAFGPGSSDEETDEKLRLAVVATQKKIAEEEQRLQTLQTDRRVKDFDEISERRKQDADAEKKTQEERERRLKELEKQEDDRRKFQAKEREALFAIQREGYASQIADQERILNNENSTYEERQAAAQKLFELKVELAKKEADFEIVEGQYTLNQVVARYAKLGNEIKSITNEYTDKQKELDDNYAKTVKSNLDGIGEYFKHNADWQKKQDKELLDQRMKNLQTWVNGVQKAVSIYNDLQSKRSQRYLSNLDNEQEEVDKNEERDRARAERTYTDAKAREEAILMIEAKADEQRRVIEQRRREEQRRQAQREKDIAVFSILTNMFVAVSKEVGGKGVAGIVTSAAITTFLSGIMAAAAALSVPAYEHGTDNHPGGPAIVGEGKSKKGYKPELVKMPGGKSFITDGPQYLPNLPAGSQVIPMPEMAMPGVAMQQMANSVMLAGGGNSAKTEALLSQVVDVMRSIDRKPVQSITIEGASIRESIVIGHKRSNKLRKNLGR